MKNRLQKIEKAINNMSDDKFNELLNELGIREEQWVPEIYETYWTVLGSGYVDCTNWLGDDMDNHRLLMKNIFKTEEEAKAQCDFNIEKAKLIKEIKDSSDVIDWENVNQIKYYLYYDHYGEEININSCRQYATQGTTHTTNKVFLENLIKNEPERVKKYLFGIGATIERGKL